MRERSRSAERSAKPGLPVRSGAGGVQASPPACEPFCRHARMAKHSPSASGRRIAGRRKGVHMSAAQIAQQALDLLVNTVWAVISCAAAMARGHPRWWRGRGFRHPRVYRHVPEPKLCSPGHWGGDLYTGWLMTRMVATTYSGRPRTGLGHARQRLGCEHRWVSSLHYGSTRRQPEACSAASPLRAREC